MYIFSAGISSWLGSRIIGVGAGEMTTAIRRWVSNFIQKRRIAVLNKSKISHVLLCCIIYRLTLFTFNTNRNKKIFSWKLFWIKNYVFNQNISCYEMHNAKYQICFYIFVTVRCREILHFVLAVNLAAKTKPFSNNCKLYQTMAGN